MNALVRFGTRLVSGCVSVSDSWASVCTSVLDKSDVYLAFSAFLSANANVAVTIQNAP